MTTDSLPSPQLTSREAFEKWARDKMHGILRPETKMMSSDDERTAYYTDAGTSWAWQAWQASKIDAALPQHPGEQPGQPALVESIPTDLPNLRHAVDRMRIDGMLPTVQGNRVIQPSAQTEAAPDAALPELPPNVTHVMRRIRRCEGEPAAQLVLEHAMLAYGHQCCAAGEAEDILRELVRLERMLDGIDYHYQMAQSPPLANQAHHEREHDRLVKERNEALAAAWSRARTYLGKT